MTTLSEAREAIYLKFLTDYTALPAASITADNEEFDPPNGAAWGRLSVRHTGSVQESLGGIGLRKFTRIASCFFQIFTPQNQGAAEADTLAQAARTVLEGVTLSGNSIRFTNSVIRETGVENGWFGVVVESFFEYTETK